MRGDTDMSFSDRLTSLKNALVETGKELATSEGRQAFVKRAFAQIIIAAIMAFIIVTILIVVMVPVINGILVATPTIESGPLNTTQTSLTTTIGSAFSLLGIVILLLAVLAIIIVIGLFQYFVGGVSGGRQ